MILEMLPMGFTVCSVEDFAEIDFESEFMFTARTDSERSVVCPSADVPGNTLRREDGWRAMRVSGTLDFSLVGVISRIAGALADGGLPVFVISTYDTDYILVRDRHIADAESILSATGIPVIRL